MRMRMRRGETGLPLWLRRRFHGYGEPGESYTGLH